MVIKGKSVLGKKIVTIQKGWEIDNIEDLIYDPKQQRVRALLVDKGGWFSDAWVILIEDVHSFGNDAVMIESDKQLRKASEVSQPIARIATHNQYLTQTKIITDDGKVLGNVTDLFFDSRSGDVHEFEVSQGYVKNRPSGAKRINVKDIVTVGKDATIVKDYAEEEFEEPIHAPSEVDLAKSELDKATERAREKFEEIKVAPQAQHPSTEMQVQNDQPTNTTAVKPFTDEKPSDADMDSQIKHIINDDTEKVADIGRDIEQGVINTQGREEMTEAARESAAELEKKNAPSDTFQRKFVSAYVGHPAPMSGVYRPVGSLGGKSEVNLQKGKIVPPLAGMETNEYELVEEEKRG